MSNRKPREIDELNATEKSLKPRKLLFIVPQPSLQLKQLQCNNFYHISRRECLFMRRRYFTLHLMGAFLGSLVKSAF